MKYFALFLGWVAVNALCVVLSHAAEFTINDQEQQNIQIMCDVAARSPELSRETRANVAGFCLLWERRMKEAAEKAAAPKAAQIPSDKQK